jgi:hypothetical protein
LIEALNYDGGKSIAFHGSADAKADLRNLITLDMGYRYHYDGYEKYEQTAHELVALGLAEWKGNRWLHATALDSDEDQIGQDK